VTLIEFMSKALSLNIKPNELLDIF